MIILEDIRIRRQVVIKLVNSIPSFNLQQNLREDGLSECSTPPSSFPPANVNTGDSRMD